LTSYRRDPTGIIAVLRAPAIIATGSEGRFRADPRITALAGFGILMLGRYLLQ
jgi:hypothetical protein